MESKSKNTNENDANERILPPYCTMREDLVISGVSGIFPDSYDLNELVKNLYAGTNCVTGSFQRWPSGYLGLPKRMGTIPSDLSEFDGEFFGHTTDQVNNVDFQIRIMMERTYSAILDAGVDPETLRGSNTGFFLANSMEESNIMLWDLSRKDGVLQLPSARIPYEFDFRGPVTSVDVACGSSVTAFHHAMVALRTGQCEQAIVAAANICIYPGTAMMFHDMSMTSQECKCKAFDASADGYARAEALVVLFIQKKKHAKRIYSILRHTKANADGYKPEGITFPKACTQERLIRDTYRECGIDPLTVKYMESHATGTKAGDPVECKAMSMAMRQGRSKEFGPLWVGALKSNIGHTEASSGLAAICKVIISFENKMIPKNIHLNVPNPQIPELFDGSLLPLNENTPFDGGIVSVNNFGFGGANAHLIMESPNIEPKDESFKIADKIPRLVLMCGRTSESIKNVFDYVKSNRSLITREFLSLINDISRQSRRKVRGMPFRGSMILHKDCQTEPPIKIEETYLNDEQRPLWYIFTGMGSQWPKMASNLMECEIFADTINKLAHVLRPYNIDLIKLLTSDNTSLELSRPIGCFVSIAAVQIAFVDLLTYLGLKPNGMIGHSIGEIGCAYADGALTAEETILAAYFRGKSVEECVKERGLMVAVGLSYYDAKKRCPNGVVVACDNSAESVTIAGPHSITTKFTEELQKENIFVKEVDSCGVSFHSPAVNSIVQSLTNQLNSIGIKPKPRTERWISTSCDDSTHSDVMYYVNNLIKPVMFYEAIQRIPENACVIEISPHSLFGSAIKRTVGSDVKFISMMTKNGTIDTLLSSIGQLYGHGYDPLIEKLYPRVEYPVPRGTPFISPLIKWDRSNKYMIHDYAIYCIEGEKIRKTWRIKIRDREHESLSGHVIEGRILYPATGYIFLVWKTLANIIGVRFSELPIQFENVTFNRATIMPKDREVTFDVYYFESSGNFEIVESDSVCVSGRAFVPNLCDSKGFLQFQHLLNDEIKNHKNNIKQNEKILMNSTDIYKELRIRGYDYGPTFQGLQCATSDGRYGKVKWTGDWIAFADTMLQIGILAKTNRGLSLPTTIELMRCDPRSMNMGDDEKIIDVVFDPKVNIGIAEGMEIRGAHSTTVPRKVTGDVTIEKYIFIPNNEEIAIDNDTKAHIEDYIDACQLISSKIERRLGKTAVNVRSNNADAAKYLLSDHNKYTIIKILNEILQKGTSENYWRLITELITENRQKLIEDLTFNGSVFCNRMILPLLSVATDNYINRPLNILEINAGGTLMAPHINRILRSDLPGFRYRFTVAHFDKELTIDTHQTSLIELNPINYKLGVTGEEVPSKSQGLIVFRDNSICGIGESSFADVRSALDVSYNALDENGFILAFLKYKNLPFDNLLSSESIDYSKRCDHFMEKVKDLKLITVCKKYDGISTMAVLLRKPQSLPIATNHFIVINNERFNWVNEYKDIQTKIKPNEDIWLLSNEKHSGVIGMGMCLRHEPNGDRIKCAYNDSDGEVKVPEEIMKMRLLQNSYRDGQWGQMRHVILDDNDFKLRETKHAYINVKSKGDLSSFSWFEAPHKYWPIIRKDNEILVNVYYSPLNFRDIMCASGRLSADAIPGDLNIEDGILGLEFSGKDENGNRVMGMVSGRGMATTVVVPDPDFLWPIPDQWTMEEACTVPCVYATSYYALLIRAKLQKGESVLIHAGSGGVGLSAIAIALSLGCEVFTTVGTPEKREFIKKQFPQLKDDHILNSRDTKFETQIILMTNGRGVDVVLNSLSEDKLLASVRCLAPNGRFCEIGKFDLSINSPLDLSSLIQNKTFHGVLLDAFFDFKKLPPHLKKQKLLIQKHIADGIANGVVKPLHRTIFEKERVEDAFRFMSTGKHMGKVVLKIRDENDPPNKTLTVMAHPRTFINPQKSIIITGGLGGFGLEVAQWLVERGARKLILTSRTGPRESYHYYAIERMKVMGADVKIWTGDSTSEIELEDLLKTAKKMGPISGIFHLAMVLSDALMENQTIENFTVAANTKILQAKYLDILSRRLCPELDYFIIFSSMVSGKGNAGQANYAFGNSACERICETRRSDGFHGMAIQWGAIGDVGFVAETLKINNVGGTIIQRMPSCISVLDRFLQLDDAVYASFITEDDKNKSSGGGDKLMAQIVHIMGINDITKIDLKSRLVDIGMDSLMGVEIKLLLEKNYNVNLNTQEIRNLTLEDLINYQNSGPVTDASQANDDIENQILVLLPNDPTVLLNTVKLGKPIFFLPSAEEQFQLMIPVAQKVMRPVYGLNWTEEFNKLPDIKTVAAKWLQIMDKIEPMGEFDIIGYSFGGVVAYEMALQLQKRGRKVKNLVTLDSSPQFMTEFGASAKRSSDETKGHIEILLLCMLRFAQFDYDETKKLLSDCKTYAERYEIAAKLLKENGIKFDEKKIIAVLEAYYLKAHMADKYVNHDKYNGNCLLIRASDSNVIKNSQFASENDYGMSKVITGNCDVMILEGDHKGFINNNPDQIAAVINKLR